jgi:hypothetical protein
MAYRLFSICIATNGSAAMRRAARWTCVEGMPHSCMFLAGVLCIFGKWYGGRSSAREQEGPKADWLKGQRLITWKLRGQRPEEAYTNATAGNQSGTTDTTSAHFRLPRTRKYQLVRPANESKRINPPTPSPASEPCPQAVRGMGGPAAKYVYMQPGPHTTHRGR